MRTRRTIGWLSLGVLLFVSSVGSVAHAEDLPPELRKNAEHSFLDGRLEDLDVILERGSSKLDRFPLALAQVWWRRTPGLAQSASPEAEASLAARRYAWAMSGDGEAPYPAVGGGGAKDPYPLISAIIRERIHRESLGAKGLPEESPLNHYLGSADEKPTREEVYIIEYCLGMQYRCYRGDEDPDQASKADAHARKAADRNRLLYLTSLGAMLVLSFIGMLIVARRRP